MTKKKGRVQLPTNLANLSQNQDKRRNMPAGADKRAANSPK